MGTLVGIVIIIGVVGVLIMADKQVTQKDEARRKDRLELKKKVMEAMVRDSLHMSKSNYEVLERQYELLGGCKEDLGIKQEA